MSWKNDQTIGKNTLILWIKSTEYMISLVRKAVVILEQSPTQECWEKTAKELLENAPETLRGQLEEVILGLTVGGFTIDLTEGTDEER